MSQWGETFSLHIKTNKNNYNSFGGGIISIPKSIQDKYRCLPRLYGYYIHYLLVTFFTYARTSMFLYIRVSPNQFKNGFLRVLTRKELENPNN